MSSPSSPSKFSKFKRGMNSIQRSLSRIRYPPLPFLHPLKSLLLYLPLIHYIPYIPYTCISWFDYITCFSRSMVWLCNKCLQVCFSCLSTYELHISLLDVGWEREGIMLLFLNTKNSIYLERREKAYTINALVRIQKYHKWKTWEGHT
jgi:hypothetical protein